jgi:hypothetical protein
MPNFPLTYPTNTRLQPRNIEFTAKTLTTQFQSPFTGKTQIYRYGGQWWELNVTLAPMFQTDAEELTAFLNALAGTVGTFTFKLPSKFLKSSTNVVLDTNSNGNDFSVVSGTVEVGKYGYDTTSNRLVQFTTATSLFPKLNPSTRYTINNSAGTRMRLAMNDTRYTVDQFMLTEVTIPMIEAI